MQQTNHPEVFWESETPNLRAEGLIYDDTCINICCAPSFFFLSLFTSLVSLSSTCPLMSTEEIVFRSS